LRGSQLLEVRNGKTLRIFDILRKDGEVSDLLDGLVDSILVTKRVVEEEERVKVMEIRIKSLLLHFLPQGDGGLEILLGRGEFHEGGINRSVDEDILLLHFFIQLFGRIQVANFCVYPDCQLIMLEVGLFDGGENGGEFFRRFVSQHISEEGNESTFRKFFFVVLEVFELSESSLHVILLVGEFDQQQFGVAIWLHSILVHLLQGGLHSGKTGRFQSALNKRVEAINCLLLRLTVSSNRSPSFGGEFGS